MLHEIGLLFLVVVTLLTIIIYLSHSCTAYYRFSFWFALLNLGWLLPQWLNAVRAGDASSGVTIAWLIIGSAISGVLVEEHCRSSVHLPRSYSVARLSRAAFFLVGCIGAFSTFYVSSVTEEYTLQYGGEWTGPATIAALLSRFSFVCLLVALHFYVRTRDRLCFWIGMLSFAAVASRVVAYGRRQSAAELLVAFFSVWLLARPRLRPATLAAVVLPLLLLAIPYIGEYRHLLPGLRFLDVPEEKLELGGISLSEVAPAEYENLVYGIEHLDQRGAIDYGGAVWNGLVKYLVPGQLVGTETKAALLIRVETDISIPKDMFARSGSTNTGYLDLYGSFGPVAFLGFALISLILIRTSPLTSNSVRSNLFGALLLPSALLSVTHTWHLFLADCIIFYFLCRLLVDEHEIL